MTNTTFYLVNGYIVKIMNLLGETSGNLRH